MKKLDLMFCFFFGVYAQNLQEPKYLFGGRNCKRGLANLAAVGDIVDWISGGRNVSEGEMPWMVRLSVIYVDARSESCGGFILDENWIITAAHCLKQVVVVKISAGRLSYAWGSSDENEQLMMVPITRLHFHPDYDQVTYRNDIALVHLPEPFEFNDHVRPICILDQESCVDEPAANSTLVDFCNTSVTSAGWGKNSSGKVSDFLKAADLKIISRNSCQQIYSPRTLYPQHICAQGQRLEEDTCQGDSGGPLFCYKNGSAVAIGIVSFGPSGCGLLFPGVYNRICNHIGWMKETITNVTLNSNTFPAISKSTTTTTTNSIATCEVPSRRYRNKVVSVANGDRLQSGEFVPAGSVVRVQCGLGFVETYPNRQSVCSPMGIWIPSISYCRIITRTIEMTTSNSGQCSSQPSYPNALVASGSSEVGSQRMVICHNGFESSGSSLFVITCLPTLQWSDSGTCELVGSNRCPEPPFSYANAVVSPGNNQPGSRRMVVCDKGFASSGLNYFSIICLRSLEWMATGSCQSIDRNSSPTTTTILPQCPMQPTYNNAEVSAGESFVGSARKVICNDGWTFFYAYCLPTLEWSKDDTCEEECSNEPHVSNGMISDGPNFIGTIRQIRCRPGYNLIGPTWILCTRSSQWSQPGICSQAVCFVSSGLIQVDNGDLIAVKNSTNYSIGSFLLFRCNSGFQLEGDSNRIICQTNGTWSKPTGRCVRDISPFLNFQCFSSLNRSIAGSLIESNSLIGLIPLKNESLVLYSKFDQATGFSYLRPANSKVFGYTALVNTFDGPFSLSNSSYSLANPNEYLGFLSLLPSVNLTSFTLSFYLRVTGNETVGIYRECYSPGARFSLTAVNLDLEVHTHNSSMYWNSLEGKKSISSFLFRNVFKRNGWQFVALSYNGANKILKLYDETANVKQEFYVSIDRVLTSTVEIGKSLRYGDWKYFSPSSAIACLSLHYQSLSQKDIALLPCACQFKDQHRF